MQFRLNKDEVIIIKQKGLVLKCMGGVLYITCDKDKKDYIIKSGKDFKIRKNVKVYIHAMESSSFEIEEKNKTLYSTLKFQFGSKIFSALNAI